MKIERITKPAFTVIGLEGSTRDGEGFIQRLWAQANSRFGEVAALARKNAQGVPVAVWGAMTDFSRSYQPWEEGFTQGLYLAGVECGDEALPPEGWTKWRVPGYVYLRAACDEAEIFPKMLAYLQAQGLTLCGAVHDMTDPATGQSYMMFPIERLD